MSTFVFRHVTDPNIEVVVEGTEDESLMKLDDAIQTAFNAGFRGISYLDFELVTAY